MRVKKEAQVWAFDTEDDSKGNVKIINFFDGQNHHTFFDKKSAVNFLTEMSSSNMQFWACNLQYDLVNLFGDDVDCLEIGYVGSRVIDAKIKGTFVYFRDTLNHWKISVKEMGMRIGLEKIDVKGDFVNVEYCRRDTEITWKFVNQMKIHYESIGCKLKSTIGSTALNYFFDTQTVKRPKENYFSTEQLEFMKLGYYGGRTEIFFNKPVEGNIQYVDFNSLYPSVMRRNFPVLNDHCCYFTNKPDFKKEGILYGLVESPRNLYVPYLPCRSDNGGLIFPLGEFSGHWTYFEIREAQKIGYKIKKIFRALEFDSGNFYPFKNFVESLYIKRLEAKNKKDDLLSDAFKLIMNNLYGKFGQGREFTKLLPLASKSDLRETDTIMGSFILRQEIGDYPKHTNMVWSSYTTAYGRHELWLGMQKVRNKKGLLIYCDTDSIIFESDKRIFKESGDLGDLKSEGDFKYAHFKLPKLYVLIEKKGEKKYRAKGVPRLNAEEFFETGKTSFKRPYKLREALRRNLSPKKKYKIIPNYWDLVEKQSLKKYDKRSVSKTGETKPLILGKGE